MQTKIIKQLYHLVYRGLKNTKAVRKLLAFIGVLGLIVWMACMPMAGYAQSVKKKINKVVIDAGHGGHDPGCHGVYSWEKDITLAVSKRVGKLIQDQLKDLKVVYTREYDWYPGLKERTVLANKEKGDLFISIHVNATPKKNTPVKGTLVLVCGPTRVDEKEDAIEAHAQNFDEQN
jgi:N-acetylmuramoyl-L-alanine amidase